MTRWLRGGYVDHADPAESLRFVVGLYHRSGWALLLVCGALRAARVIGVAGHRASTTHSLFTKGAALTSALAFMFASTNLAVEVAPSRVLVRCQN